MRGFDINTESLSGTLPGPFRMNDPEFSKIWAVTKRIAFSSWKERCAYFLSEWPFPREQDWKCLHWQTHRWHEFDRRHRLALSPSNLSGCLAVLAHEQPMVPTRRSAAVGDRGPKSIESAPWLDCLSPIQLNRKLELKKKKAMKNTLSTSAVYLKNNNHNKYENGFVDSPFCWHNLPDV